MEVPVSQFAPIKENIIMLFIRVANYVLISVKPAQEITNVIFASIIYQLSQIHNRDIKAVTQLVRLDSIQVELTA